MPSPAAISSGLVLSLCKRPTSWQTALCQPLVWRGGGANMLISGNAGAVWTTICPTCMPNTFVAPAGAATSGPVDMFSGQPVDFKYISGNVGRNQGLGDPYIRGISPFAGLSEFRCAKGLSVELRADLFNFANHTNFWQFNAADILSGWRRAAPPPAVIFTPAAGCPGRAGLDVTTGHYIGNNGQVLTLADLKHGRVSFRLEQPPLQGTRRSRQR